MAARQASRLGHPDGRMSLVAATHVFDAMSGRWGPETIPWDPTAGGVRELEGLTDELRRRAGASLEWAARQVRARMAVETHIVNGRAVVELRDEATRVGADLVAVGAHGDSRLRGALLGSVASELVHECAASVLVSRAPFDPESFPARVVVGVDGSDASLAAVDVARRVAADPSHGLEVVVARPERELDIAALRQRLGDIPVREDRRRPVEALSEAAAAADLLVVGARGVTGLRTLGSVSERLAHSARSSVLVVQGR